MSLICYKPKRFKPGSMSIIEQANDIIEEYRQQGFSLTLRQLYYQFVARDIIANKQTEYSRLGGIINDARLAGYISWDAIEDRTRNLRKSASWESPNQLLEACANQFRIDMWENQPAYCEVWIEKDALVGVIQPTCNEWRVPYFACRGYSSQSEQWEAGQRLVEQIDNYDKEVHIFHLGDHDPSGLDMTRDNEDRLRMFIDHHTDSSKFHIHRLALNMDQVKKHRPPPNPAKMTDSRFEGYAALHGNKSWELDALEPKVIARLISSEIVSIVDQSQWDEDDAREDRLREQLRNLADNTEFDE